MDYDPIIWYQRPSIHMGEVFPAPDYPSHPPQLPPPWRELFDGVTGRYYYWNTETNHTQFENPWIPSQPLHPSASPDMVSQPPHTLSACPTFHPKSEIPAKSVPLDAQAQLMVALQHLRNELHEIFREEERRDQESRSKILEKRRQLWEITSKFPRPTPTHHSTDSPTITKPTAQVASASPSPPTPTASEDSIQSHHQSYAADEQHGLNHTHPYPNPHLATLSLFEPITQPILTNSQSYPQQPSHNPLCPHPTQPISLHGKPLKASGSRTAMAAKIRAFKKGRQSELLRGAGMSLRFSINRKHNLWVVQAKNGDVIPEFMEELYQLGVGPHILTDTSHLQATTPSSPPPPCDVPDQKEVSHPKLVASILIDELETLPQSFSVAVAEELNLASLEPQSDAVVVFTESPFQIGGAYTMSLTSAQNPISVVVKAPMVCHPSSTLKIGGSYSPASVLFNNHDETEREPNGLEIVQRDWEYKKTIAQHVSREDTTSADSTIEQKVTKKDQFYEHEFAIVFQCCKLANHYPTQWALSVVISPCFNYMITGNVFCGEFIGEANLSVGNNYEQMQVSSVRVPMSLVALPSKRNAKQLDSMVCAWVKFDVERVICLVDTRSAVWLWCWLFCCLQLCHCETTIFGGLLGCHNGGFSLYNYQAKDPSLVEAWSAGKILLVCGNFDLIFAEDHVLNDHERIVLLPSFSHAWGFQFHQLDPTSGHYVAINFAKVLLVFQSYFFMGTIGLQMVVYALVLSIYAADSIKLSPGVGVIMDIASCMVLRAMGMICFVASGFVTRDTASLAIAIPHVGNVISFEHSKTIEADVPGFGHTGRVVELITDSRQELPCWLLDYAELLLSFEGDHNQSSCSSNFDECDFCWSKNYFAKGSYNGGNFWGYEVAAFHSDTSCNGSEYDAHGTASSLSFGDYVSLVICPPYFPTYIITIMEFFSNVVGDNALVPSTISSVSMPSIEVFLLIFLSATFDSMIMKFVISSYLLHSADSAALEVPFASPACVAPTKMRLNHCATIVLLISQVSSLIRSKYELFSPRFLQTLADHVCTDELFLAVRTSIMVSSPFHALVRKIFPLSRSMVVVLSLRGHLAHILREDRHFSGLTMISRVCTHCIIGMVVLSSIILLVSLKSQRQDYDMSFLGIIAKLSAEIATLGQNLYESVAEGAFQCFKALLLYSFPCSAQLCTCAPIFEVSLADLVYASWAMVDTGQEMEVIFVDSSIGDTLSNARESISYSKHALQIHAKPLLDVLSAVARAGSYFV